MKKYNIIQTMMPRGDLIPPAHLSVRCLYHQFKVPDKDDGLVLGHGIIPPVH